ncbi:MAG: CcoQ/FixQ family Cbb3-type cytochrome c oxidase assembly chaperone [Methanobacteriota archaeon]|nr:MAG: CcoQ/FixQ family Cbb3-type cytochrome c oxidase assembly chaperone [Euryarchaeota archaeon]
MFKEIFQNIPGIEIWPIIGLFLFIIAFALILVYVFFFMDKSKVKHMANLPLEENSPNNGDNAHG